MSRERIRTLKPEFFRDEKIKSMSRDARYVTVGLISRADDRGRQANEPQAILGYIFPGGDVTVRQLTRWVIETVETGVAKAYQIGPFEYLWLPNYWKHQVINKPTESTYPPHPDDGYADVPITDAIRAYRLNGGTERLPSELREFVRDDVRPPRASAHSAPFRSDPGVVGTVEGTAELLAINRAIAILAAVWPKVDPVGVENAAATDPDADLVAAAHLAATWGSGENWTMSAAATLRSAMRKLHEEQSAGRSKAQRGADDLAAVTRLMGGQLA